jgi:hypothetical protein
MNKKRWTLLVAAVLAGLATVAACGDDDEKKCNQDACVQCFEDAFSGTTGDTGDGDSSQTLCEAECANCEAPQ